MLRILLVAVGGALGSVARYLMGGWIHSLTGALSFPVGTVCINILGCFLIGLVMGLAEERRMIAVETRIFLQVGFLGGFTTFSTFGYEAIRLLGDRQTLGVLVYMGSQVIVGLVAVWLGLVLARVI